MTDLNNKHLPSDINSLTRKDLVEIYDIHAEEFRKLLAENAELRDMLKILVDGDSINDSSIEKEVIQMLDKGES